MGIRLGMDHLKLSSNGKYLSAHYYWGSHAVYIFKWDGNSWSRFPTPNSSFGSKGIIFSKDGSIIANCDAGTKVIFLYLNSSSSWTNFKTASPGFSSAVNGITDFDVSEDFNVVAISNIYNDSNRGIVKVYKWNGSGWINMGNDLVGEAIGDEFGRKLSISADGRKLIVGAPGNDGGGNSAGHARVFEWNGENWIQQSTDIDGEAANDRCGSVVISGDGTRVAVGAPENDGGALNGGHVRIFK
jgi:hypothetical protein